MAKGYWLLVLHAHLPFVRHPEYNDSLEERWLYEAITETYIPLLEVFERLINEGHNFKITMTITPPLANMLEDKLLQDRYIRYIENLIELSEKEIFRTKFLPEFHKCALMYNEKFNRAREIFVNKYQKNLLNGFKKFQESGNLEIITCGATHGFLPLMEMYPNCVRAQVLVGVTEYKRIFNKYPQGIWNGECGYYPGLEKFLEEGNIKYFFVDTHGILHASNKPKYGIFAPMSTPNKIAFFARDVETSVSVWSSKEGYPGDYNYREFYRDIGYDLEYEYIKPYIHESGTRISTGIKYYRITSKETPLENKEPYNPDIALMKTFEHAQNFIFNREKQIEYVSQFMDREPLVVSMYDAELFGHWWFEGPEFIYNCLKLFSQHPELKTITPTEYLSKYPINQVATPPLCSWGYKGYTEFWLNENNDWIYPHLHKSYERMIELANKFKNTKNKLIERALNQAAREVLLAQSSDWAFIMKTNTMVEYAKKRTIDHIIRVMKIYDMVINNDINIEWLEDIENKDNIFPEIDFRVYSDNYKLKLE